MHRKWFLNTAPSAASTFQLDQNISIKPYT